MPTRMIYAFIRICLALPLFLTAVPADAQIVVEGKNGPAVDVRAVQAAVDQDGKVVLKGAFDFGEGRVTITKDVSIIGEPDQQGAARAKIKGGYWTFHSPMPAQMPPPAPGPRIAIRHIDFDGALWTPIRVARASGVSISGNRITNVNVRPHPRRGRASISSTACWWAPGS
jgi:hypothetical protein